MIAILAVDSRAVSQASDMVPQDSTTHPRLSKTERVLEKTLKKAMTKAMTKIDTIVGKGVNRQYIEIPKRPWQVIVRSNLNQASIDMSKSHLFSTERGLSDMFSFSPSFRTKVMTSIGVWAGYRGYGIGFSMTPGKKGSYVVLSALGARYGVQIRYRSFDQKVADISTSSFQDSYSKEVELNHPIHVKSFFAEAFYLFSSKRFSYAAAYDMSTIQLRSAGTFLVGATWFQSDINLTDTDVFYIMLMNGIGRVKMWQGSLGGGYSYNWVPKKGWLVNVTVMPTLSFLNRIKFFRYDYEFVDINETPMNISDITDSPAIEESHGSSVRLNVDARVSVTYNWERYFINVMGQYNHFRYRYADQNGGVKDWYINASLGVRF